MPKKSKVTTLFSLQKHCLFCLATAALVSASTAVAQAPPVVVDAQQTIGSSYYDPRSVAVAPNGTVYVADTNANRVVQLITQLPASSNQSVVGTSLLYTLREPTAVAVDANGDLFIADYPNVAGAGQPRILEVVANNGVLTGTVNLIFQGGLLTQVTSLVVDRQNTLFIAAGGLSGGIYSMPSSGGTPTKVPITGLPSGFVPGALVRDSSMNLYFANTAATNGGVYMAPAAGGSAQPVSTGAFAISQPTGLALDSAGDLFVLSLVTTGGNTATQVLDIPGDSPTTPYIIPATGLLASSAMALDPSGNLDVVEAGSGLKNTGLVTQLDYLNAINLGSAAVFSSGLVVPFNFEFNAPATISGFQAVTLGDLGSKSSDVVPASGGTCVNQTLDDTTSAYQPYTCAEPFEALPQYVGSRVSAIQVEGSGSEILSSSSVYGSGLGGAQISYPMDVTTTATGLVSPQGVAVSGFDQTVYIADFYGGSIYATGGLNGTTLNSVPTGTLVLSAPSAVAINGEGDLYVADFDLGQVFVIPTRTGKAPAALETGFLLQHPISLALDYLGNLYIGDAGADGDGAVLSSPGYVVKVPYNGTPYRMTIPSVPTIVFPQALATDGSNGNLYIGDGGDGVSVLGQTVEVSANGSTASVVSFGSETVPTNPTGLIVDAAENLYVLDGTADTITVVPPVGASYMVGFTNTLLAGASALAGSAGSQSMVIANIGDGSGNSLVLLNGNSSTLAFPNVKVGKTSATQTATVYNIGNESLTLDSPYYSLTESGTVFNVLNGSTCNKVAKVDPSGSCTVNVQFSPAAVQSYTGQLVVNSGGYNNAVPVVNLSGTGTAKASFEGGRPHQDDESGARLFRGRVAGRKSFARARRREDRP